MPELPDITIYTERINALFQGQPLLGSRLASPFLLRSYEPPLSTLKGRVFKQATRLGKQLIFEFSPEVYAVFHLMIAGRFHLAKPGAKLPKRGGLLSFDFESHSLFLTEVATHKRARLNLVAASAELKKFDRGALEPLTATTEQWQTALLRENRTLKRALTDPNIISGIGNAYSDEILLEARLSPTTWTTRLHAEDVQRLATATRAVIERFTEAMRREVGSAFPEKVTAFRPDMSAHGRYGKPCPQCSTPIQRVRFANNELNYCTSCQTGGKLLADRGLSRLLRGDWPKTLEELEEHKQERTQLSSTPGLKPKPGSKS